MDLEARGRILEQLAGKINECYRRGVQRGYRPPMVIVSLHGSLRNNDEIEGEIKTADPWVAPPEVLGELRPALESVRDGCFLVMIVEVGLGTSFVEFPVPDQN